MSMRFLMVLVAVSAAFCWGVIAGVYHVFPFQQLQAVKQVFIPPAPEFIDFAALESDADVDFEYDWENDPIGAAFHGRVPPFLDNILERYVERRQYVSTDFPLSPERHTAFRSAVVQVMLDSMTGDGGEGHDWGVDTDEKHSATLQRFSVEEIDVVSIEALDVHLYAFTIHDTGDVVPVAACFPGSRPAPAVIAFSGHTHHGLRDLFVDRDSYQGAIALHLCQQGFATAAVEKIDSGIASRLFQQKGERWRSDFWADDELEAATTILAVDDYWIPARQQMANIAVTEWMASQDRVDHERMGTVGVSLGGWLAVHTALVNGRIKAVANFGGMWSYLEQYADDRDFTDFKGVNDYSQLFAGVWRLGDQNRFALAAAPTVMLIGYGAQDHPYTDFVDFYHPTIARQYEALGAGANLEIHVHDGGHVLPVEAATAFFKSRLKPGI